MGAAAAAGAAGTLAAAGAAAAATASAGSVTATAPAGVRCTVAMQASLSKASSLSTSVSVPSASISVCGHHHRNLHDHQQQQQQQQQHRHQQQQGHEHHRPQSQNRNRRPSANDGHHHSWIQATISADNIGGNGAHRQQACALQSPLPRHLLHGRAHHHHHHFAVVHLHALPHAHTHRLSCPHGHLHQPHHAQRQCRSCFLGKMSANLHLRRRRDQQQLQHHQHQQQQQQQRRRRLQPQALGRQWVGESGGSLEEMQMQDHFQRPTADPLLLTAAALQPPAAAPAASGAASPTAPERRTGASVCASVQRSGDGGRCAAVQQSPLLAGSLSRRRSCSFGAVRGCGGMGALSSGGKGSSGRGSMVLVRAAAADAPSPAGAEAGSQKQQQEDTGKVGVAQQQDRQGGIQGDRSTSDSSSSSSGSETLAAADTKEGPPAASPDKLGAAAVTAAGASDGSAAAAAAAGTKRGAEAEADAEAEAEAQLQMQAELERLALQQAENDVAREAAWRVRLRRATGRLQGSPWDPLPGGDMEYSELRALLRQGVVEHVEYGDYGKHVAVILPHSLEDVERSAAAAGGAAADADADASSTAGSVKQGEKQEQAGQEEDEVVWLRHVVRRMPADAHNALWAELRQQNIVTLPPPSSLPQTTPLAAGGGALLSPQQQQASTSVPAAAAAAAPGQQMAHVHIRNHEAAVAPQVAATLGLAAAWVVRLAVAVVVFRWLDAKLLPIYRPTKLDDRPRSTSRKLTAALDPALGTMGQSRARYISAEEKTGVTFDDFAGQDYVKRELQEVVRILREAKEFEQLGVYCPKGVLLFGPPGTGKTLLAKAIAGEAGVPFFSVSGSEFVEMFAGVAASRVKDLFFRARQFAPSIIFIDEIDAIGAKRGSSEGDEGGSIEREQGLIQILTELDGFQEQAAKVLVIGATNRLDMLDPALLRKGRFDKVVRVGLPTEEGRYNILQVHARNKHFESNEERDKLLKEVAVLTPEFSGAELMNVLNEAAILAVREDRDEIRREELLRALDRQAGEFKTGEEDVVHAPEVRLRTAYREAAIAVLACALPDPAHPILKTTLEDYDPLPNTEYVKVRHRTFTQKHHMINAIVRAFAPPAAERLVFGAANASWQAGVAYREAVQLADYVILRSGMSALGGVTYETQKDLMKHLTPKVVALRDEYLRYGMQACDAIVREYRSALDTIAERLLEENVVDGAEIQHIFNAAPRFPQPPVRPIDEYGALVHAGRWGIYGNSLPGRATFSPGNCGYVTFAAPRPRQVQRIADMTWREIDRIWEERKRELEEMDAEEEESGEVQLLQPSLLL